jgi:hypothetical protein
VYTNTPEAPRTSAVGKVGNAAGSSRTYVRRRSPAQRTRSTKPADSSLQVMRDQIRPQTEGIGELTVRRIFEDQQVRDRQPSHITQRRVHPSRSARVVSAIIESVIAES